MINIQRLQDTLINFKSTRIIIPNSNKFTQNTAFQMKIDELTNINYNENNDLKQYITNNINRETIIQKENTEIVNDNYNNGDSNNIPDNLKSVFGNDFKNYYLYGNRNEHSFFLSIIFLTQNNFIIKNDKEKHSNMISFKRELNLQVDNLYKNNNYKDLNFNKKDLTCNIQNSKTIIDYSICILCSDFLNKNICIIDLEKNIYNYIKTFDNSKTDFVLIIKEKNNYHPIMNIDNNHVLDNTIFEKITTHFVKQEVEEKYLERKENNIKLKAISNYKLPELQKLCKEKNINIKKSVNEKEKNKTKQELFNELKTN